MIDVKPLTLFLHLAAIKLGLIISDQDFENFKSTNDIFLNKKKMTLLVVISTKAFVSIPYDL
jgi:helix-turn-helix protein